MANIGYIRVSTTDQNLDRQLDGINLDKVFEDTQSGRDLNRPGLQALLSYIRPGDTLYVHELSRLSRNIVDLNTTVKKLIVMGITVKFIKENLTLSKEESSASDIFFLNSLGAFAQYQRDSLREAQAEGIKKAKERGVYTNRKRTPKYSLEFMKKIVKHLNAGFTKREVAEIFDISQPSVNYINVTMKKRKQHT